MKRYPITHLLFSILVSLFVLPHPFRCSDYYVKPHANSSCPDDVIDPCMTLDEYVNRPRDLGLDPKFLFLHGAHELHSPMRLSYLNSFQMVSALITNGSEFETGKPTTEIQLKCCNIILDSIPSITLADLIISSNGSLGLVVMNTMRIQQQLHLLDHFFSIGVSWTTILIFHILNYTLQLIKVQNLMRVNFNLLVILMCRIPQLTLLSEVLLSLALELVYKLMTTECSKIL